MKKSKLYAGILILSAILAISSYISREILGNRKIFFSSDVLVHVNGTFFVSCLFFFVLSGIWVFFTKKIDENKFKMFSFIVMGAMILITLFWEGFFAGVFQREIEYLEALYDYLGIVLFVIFIYYR